MGAMVEAGKLSPTPVGPPGGLDFDRLDKRAKESTERAKRRPDTGFLRFPRQFQLLALRPQVEHWSLITLRDN